VIDNFAAASFAGVGALLRHDRASRAHLIKKRALRWFCLLRFSRQFYCHRGCVGWR